MLMPRSVGSLLLIVTMVFGANSVSSQNYPNKPLRIVTGGIGGGSDSIARLTAQAIAVGTGQQAVVDNRASGLIPGITVASASPDGYTLLVIGSALWITRFFQDLPYDPVTDFSPITLVAGQPNILVVHPTLQIKSVKELIALAQAKPGALNYSSSGATGGSTQLAAELFKVMAGVNIVRVNYKSSGPRMADLLSGVVQLEFATAGSVVSHIKSGRLIALAVTSAGPSALLPDLPTVAASGLPGYEAITMTGLFAPAKTPTTIINRLNQETIRFLTKSDVKEKLLNSGVEPVGNSPAEFSAMIKSDMAKWGKLIKDAGIRAE